MSDPSGNTWAPVGLLRAIWRYRWLVAAVTLAAALVGFFGSALLPTRYEAVSRLQLADPEQGGVFGEMQESVEGDPYLLDEAERITSTPILERAANRLTPSPTADELRDRVQGLAVIELSSIRVTGSAPTAERAANIADAVALAYQDESTEERTERARIAAEGVQAYIDQLDEELQAADAALQRLRAKAVREAESATLPQGVSQTAAVSQILDASVEYQTQLLERQAILTQHRNAKEKVERIRIDADVVGSGVRRFDRAEVPGAPAQPQRNLLGVVGGLLGFLAATGFAWRLAEDHAAAQRSEDAASSVGVPLLGDVPPFRPPSNINGLITRGGVSRARIIAAPYSNAGESFQYTLSSLLSTLRTDGRTPVVVVAGTARGDGGTTTALNIGFAASQRQMRVAVIDTDFRQRSLTKLCSLSAEEGISENRVNPLHGYGIAHEGLLEVVPTGNAFGDAIAYLNSREFIEAVEAARSAHDLVVLDAPPVLAAADALSASTAADGILLVVGMGRTHDDLEEAARLLSRASAPLVGYVFNQPRRRWLGRLRR